MTIDRDTLRAEMEAGFTAYEWAVGRYLCPAGQQCPSGPLTPFPLLKSGRIPMHRDYLGEACPGANQKPTTAPLQLRPAA
jgi:hypothetical protein